MHYKNGREAKNGDKVVLLPSWGSPVVGILYDATAGNDYCNGKIAPILPSDPCPNLKEVLHLDDVLATYNPDPEYVSRVKSVMRRLSSAATRSETRLN